MKTFKEFINEAYRPANPERIRQQAERQEAGYNLGDAAVLRAVARHLGSRHQGPLTHRGVITRNLGLMKKDKTMQDAKDQIGLITQTNPKDQEGIMKQRKRYHQAMKQKKIIDTIARIQGNR